MAAPLEDPGPPADPSPLAFWPPGGDARWFPQAIDPRAKQTRHNRTVVIVPSCRLGAASRTSATRTFSAETAKGGQTVARAGQERFMTPRPRSVVVSARAEGPLDRAVRELLGASWGTARAWIASGKVRVEGELVIEPNARVRAGQTIGFDERAPRPTV